MTQEDRLNRVERIARLLSRAGLRLRRDIHELEAKINMVVNSQINYEDELIRSQRDHNEKIAQIDDKIAIMIDAQIKYEEQFAHVRREQEEKITEIHRQLGEERADLIKAQTRTDDRLAILAGSQEQTDRRLDALIELVRKQQNGEALS